MVTVRKTPRHRALRARRCDAVRGPARGQELNPRSRRAVSG
jgi:hypothetical protein